VITFSPKERALFESGLNSAFSPHTPINQAGFFRGRTDQIRAVVDTLRARGLHVAIYGERGVGKTSLASIIQDFLGEVQLVVSRVNCVQQDTFDSTIRRVLENIDVVRPRPGIGFTPMSTDEPTSLIDMLPVGRVSPDAAAAFVSRIPGVPILIFDEFDRLRPSQTAAFADFIKSLSDRGADSKVVVVGVAEDINALIESHASIERCLRQIPLPRMSDDELGQIVDEGLRAAKFSLDSASPRKRIIAISQGFPHYTHLLALYGARAALDEGRTTITDEDVLTGIFTAVERAEQSQRELYYRATTGTKATNLWKQVVTACALADSDDRGYFSSRAVQDSLSSILGRPIIQQTVAFHLGKLIEESRGQLLDRVGPQRRYRYRFRNPLMRPFIILQGIKDGLISQDGQKRSPWRRRSTGARADA